MLRLTLFSRPGCHLCDDMLAVLQRIRQRLPFDLEEIDISTDPALEQEYGSQIPVLFIDGRIAARYRVKEEELVRRLERLLNSRQ